MFAQGHVDPLPGAVLTPFPAVIVDTIAVRITFVFLRTDPDLDTTLSSGHQFLPSAGDIKRV